MKKLLLSFCVFLLTGCFYQTVNENDIRLATKFCESKGSQVQEITATFLGDENVICKNNERAHLSDLKF